MSKNYTNLQELRDKKKRLRSEIEGLEDLLTFKDKKESLSVLTGGITDKYLKETENKEGEKHLSLDTQNIMREVADGIREKTSSQGILGFANSTVDSGLLETAVRLGAVTMVGNLVRKNLNNTSWKKRIIALGVIYVAPILLKYVREKLEDYQHTKTTSSLKKLI